MSLRDWWDDLGPVHESYLVTMVWGGITASSMAADPITYGSWWQNALADVPAVFIFSLIGIVIASKLTEQHFDVDEFKEKSGDGSE